MLTLFWRFLRDVPFADVCWRLNQIIQSGLGQGFPARMVLVRRSTIPLTLSSLWPFLRSSLNKLPILSKKWSNE